MTLVPPTSLRAGHTLVAGRGVSTVLPDLDFETYSEAGFIWDAATNKWTCLEGAPSGKKGLGVVGAASYAMHPSTQVLSLAYDLKDGRGPHLWTPGLLPPIDLFRHIQQNGVLEAWNSSFEHWIWNHVCVPRYGWPRLPIEQLRCAMGKARAFALPGRLELASKVTGVSEQKDPRGVKLLRKFSIPRNPTKGDPQRRHPPAPGDPDTEALYAYNEQDIKAETAVSQVCPDLEGEELEFWLADQRINYRGVAIDVQTTDACIQIVNQVLVRGDAELYQITGGAVARASELQKLQQWCATRGHAFTSLDEEHITAALSSDLPADVHRALQIRQECGSAAVKKVFSIRNQLAPDGRLHDLFSYHAARTGRATGNGPQPTNLPNSGPMVAHCECGCYRGRSVTQCPECGATEHIEKEWGIAPIESAIRVLQTGSVDAVEWYYGAGNALSIVSGCLRSLFVAASGHDLICSDYSSIEAVSIAEIAGEKWRQDVFRTHGRIYEESAARLTGIPFDPDVTHSHRKLGKFAELASIYQAWIGGWKQFGAGDFLDDEEIKKHILAWRAASPAIVELWGGQERNWEPERFGVEGAVVNAIQYPGVDFHVQRLDGTYSGVTYRYHENQDVLYCRIPSGRFLHYHRPRLVPSERRSGTWSISYEGYNTNPKNGAVGWIRMESWGGRFVENINQATCRDILRPAIIRLEKAGYPVVLHVYDEIVSEIPEGFGSVEEFEQLMTVREDWFNDWPIRAKGGWRGKRYRK